MATEIKNIRVHEYGKVQVDAWKLEAPILADEEVIVRIYNAPINPVDTYVINGQIKWHTQFPFVAGIEGYGQIVSVGKNIDNKLINKKVLVNSPKGTYNTQGVYSRNEVYVLDDDINLEAVNQNFFINPLTAAGLINNVKDTKATAIIYTAASSNVGKWLTIFAHKNNIKTIAIVRNENTTATLKSLDADIVLNSSTEGFHQLLQDAINNLKPTVLLDALAGSFPIQILEKMPANSTLINYGRLEAEGLESINLHAISNGKSIKGFMVNFDLLAKEKHDDIEKLINKLYKGEKIVHEDTQEFGFEQINEALQQHEQRQKRFVLKF